jgi:hypothetical protein
MPRPSELREAALLMVRPRGTYAAVHATQRALILQSEGNVEVAAIWQRISNEITRLRAEERETYATSLALYDPKARDDWVA